jgi:hypothetical protein
VPCTTRLRSTCLSDRAVVDTIKRRAADVGLEGSFAGHSLRSGFATEGYGQGPSELAIVHHGRWKSANVMCGYVADCDAAGDPPGRRLSGLDFLQSLALVRADH